MSDAYNPQADVAGQIEALQLELKSLIAKRDRTREKDERAVLQQQVDDLEHQIRSLQRKLKE